MIQLTYPRLVLLHGAPARESRIFCCNFFAQRCEAIWTCINPALRWFALLIVLSPRPMKE
jgi:hypothetical protein